MPISTTERNSTTLTSTTTTMNFGRIRTAEEINKLASAIKARKDAVIDITKIYKEFKNIDCYVSNTAAALDTAKHNKDVLEQAGPIADKNGKVSKNNQSKYDTEINELNELIKTLSDELAKYQ